MKLKGRAISGPNYAILVIPRPDGDLVFKAQAIRDLTDFEKLCPDPKAPMKMVPGGRKIPDLQDADYLNEINTKAKKQSAYTVLESLKPSEIEWDTVDIQNPDTWLNWEEDLKNAGLNYVEIQRIMYLVLEANSLDEDKLEEARARFVQREAELRLSDSSSQNNGHRIMPIGVPANASE